MSDDQGRLCRTRRHGPAHGWTFAQGRIAGLRVDAHAGKHHCDFRGAWPGRARVAGRAGHAMQRDRVCVPQDADVLADVETIAAHARPGCVVIDHSTVSSRTAREAQARMRVAGGDLHRCAGVRRRRRRAQRQAVDHGRRRGCHAGTGATGWLECYAAKINHMGGVGAGQNTKAVNQVLVAGIAQAVCEGLALGDALGLDAER
jgi:3-hydroxyisobutyrate dehydrogenase-like beta-hydroxyacid dehydrogenase